MISRLTVALILGVATPTAGHTQPASIMASASSAWDTLSTEDREAIGRVVFAEAANQGEEGLAAVTHTVLNRIASGQFGSGAQAVLDAPGQFEPVTRAGGSWRLLPSLTAEQRIVFGTILDLILQGRLPDLTNGSTFFQNPRIVADRAAANQVAPELLNFGGQVPAAVVRDHSFYRSDASAPEGTLPGLQRAGHGLATASAPKATHSILIRLPGVGAIDSHIRIIRGISSRPLSVRQEASATGTVTVSR